MDLFDNEQQIYNIAMKHLNEMQDGTVCTSEEYEYIVKEYGKLLKQLRRVTTMNDKMAGELNTSKLDLLDKIQYDELTGVYSRGFMEENMKHVIESDLYSGDKLSVFMIDIDFFKKYNDTYGHLQGDECLKQVAHILSDSIKQKDDFIARYGGEEFVVILPHTNENGARKIAGRMLKNIANYGIPHKRNRVANCVTISIGVTTGNVQCSQKYEDYLEQSDKALYMSKQNGRNQYTFLDL